VPDDAVATQELTLMHETSSNVPVTDVLVQLDVLEKFDVATYTEFPDVTTHSEVVGQVMDDTDAPSDNVDHVQVEPDFVPTIMSGLSDPPPARHSELVGQEIAPSDPI
jgi:hypothetical protein